MIFSIAVILSATIQGEPAESYQVMQVILFPDILVAYGITDITSFQKFGIFKCEVSGVYQIAVSVIGTTSESGFRIYKNDVRIADAFSSVTNGYDTSTTNVVDILDVNDTISVKSRYKMGVYGYNESNVAIIQIH